MNTIKVLIVEPNKEPYTKEIENDYKVMQKIVGGFIEFAELNKDVDLVCNDEGKVNGFQHNRTVILAEDSSCPTIDIIAGTFFLCEHDDEGGSISLSEENIKKYFELYKL